MGAVCLGPRANVQMSEVSQVRRGWGPTGTGAKGALVRE